jgi:DNA invertase Pin-like site-specific DNA recombinase
LLLFGNGRSDVKAVLFAAKSTEDKRGSIKTQLGDCRAMAEQNGWEVAGEFSDEAFSAWKGNRGPGLAAAKELAEQEAPSILVVQHSDRLARGDGRTADHLADVLAWAVRADVTIRSVQDDLFADPRMARVMAAVMGQRNEEDSRRKAAATKAGLARIKEAGIYVGPVPFGWRRVEGKLLVEKSQARIVRRIFKEFLAGRSMVAIARGLHSDGIPTQTGKVWRQAQVSGILRQPVHAGLLRSEGGGLIQGQQEAIIDEATWRKVQDLLASNSTKRGRPAVGNHLFKGGMLRCGQCGDPMVPRTKREPFQTYYCCNGHVTQGNDYCTQGCVKRSVVDEAVYAYFESIALDVESTRDELQSALDERLAEIRGLCDQATLEAQKARERLDRVRRDYQDGKLDADDWSEQRLQLQGEQDAAAAQLERLRESEREEARATELLDPESETLKRLATLRKAIAGEVQDAQDIAAVRAALAHLFDRFVLHVEGDRGRIQAIANDASGAWTIDEAMRPAMKPGARLPLRFNNANEGSGCL